MICFRPLSAVAVCLLVLIHSGCSSARPAYETMRNDFGLKRDTSTFVIGNPEPAAEDQYPGPGDSRP
jgi:hypothetical protein